MSSLRMTVAPVLGGVLGFCFLGAPVQAKTPLQAKTKVQIQKSPDPQKSIRKQAQAKGGAAGPAVKYIMQVPLIQPRAEIELEEIRLETPDAIPKSRAPVAGFPVRRIVVEGSTLFSEERLHEAIASYEGREQSLETLQGAIDAIQALYRDQGYLTTQAYIPPQAVNDGTLLIRVREGTIGKVLLEGAKYYKASILRQGPVSQRPGALFNVTRLEEELNRSNRMNDGYRFKAVLKAGELPGQTDIRLQVLEKQPLQITPTFDNQGRPGIGMFRSGWEIRNDSLTGRGDRLDTRWLTSAGAQMATASYSLPINRFGTELTASVGYGKVTPNFSGRSVTSLLGDSLSYSVGIMHPLDRDHHWTLDAGLSRQRVNTYVNNMQTDLNDIRAFQTGLTYDRYDRWGRTYNRVQAMAAFGGTGGLTGSGRFFKMENYFTRIVLLPKRQMLFLKGYGQWSPNAVPMAEQFQVGGYNSVRGFTQGALMGDKGFSAGIEHRFPIPGLGRLSPSLDRTLQGAWFYDIGRIWLNGGQNRVLATLGSAKAPLMQSVGVGLRAQFSRYLQGFLDVGFVLSGRQTIDGRQQPMARLHLGIRTDLMPTDYRPSGSRAQAFPLPTPAFSTTQPPFRAAQATPKTQTYR